MSEYPVRTTYHPEDVEYEVVWDGHGPLPMGRTRREQERFAARVGRDPLLLHDTYGRDVATRTASRKWRGR